MGKKWIFLVFLAFPAWGYRLTTDFNNGFYWASLPVSISVEDSDSQRKQRIISIAKTAINEWESRTGLSLWDFSETSQPNVIRWSNNFAAETRMDPFTVLAVAIRYTNGPYFARTEIVINGGHQLNTDNDYLHLRTTLTHELGHTMGLDHSDVGSAVMAPTLQANYRGLQPDDLSGMEEAHSITHHRQLTGYVSPLAYQTEEKSSQPLSCGTVGVINSPTVSFQGVLSLAAGLLISFVRKVWKWFKSRL
jgi:hypothetical protein